MTMASTPTSEVATAGSHAASSDLAVGALCGSP